MKKQMLIKVSSAEYLNDYRIVLTFSDGKKGIVDLKDEIDGEIFEPLNNIEYFKSFRKDKWTIGWDCGADFAPEFLYELANKQSS